MHITGLGIASALGVHTAEEFFAAMHEPPLARARRVPITAFDSAALGDLLAVVDVPSFNPPHVLGGKGLRVLDRLTKLLLVAARTCLHNAHLKTEGAWTDSPKGYGTDSPSRIGVACSNAYGSLEAISELDRVARVEDPRYINPAKFPNTVSNSASGYVSIWEDLRAVNVSVSNGNCGLDAFSCAELLLDSERADAILGGGGEAISEPLVVAVQRLGLLGALTLGEGACFVALEGERSAARERPRYGSIVGSGAAFESPPDNHQDLVYASTNALVRSIRQALAEARMAASDVDIVASGVSGLASFDEAEQAAIAAVVGDCPVAAPKFVFGETFGAGGALALAAALAWMHGAPPMPLIVGKRPDRVQTALITNVGYYGNASATLVCA